MASKDQCPVIFSELALSGPLENRGTQWRIDIKRVDIIITNLGGLAKFGAQARLLGGRNLRENLIVVSSFPVLPRHYLH